MQVGDANTRAKVTACWRDGSRGGARSERFRGATSRWRQTGLGAIQKTNVPTEPCGPMGTKVGDGSSPISLSHADIWRTSLRKAASFPTLFPAANGVFGLVAGPFRAFPPLNFRVRLFSSLRLMVAPPACEPGQDTSMISSASWPLSSGTATAFGRAFAPCHGSRLFALRLYFAHKPAVSFSTSPAFRKVFPCPAQTLFPSRLECSLCPPFGFFRLAVFKKETARVIRSVLVHSNNRLPFG
jgi:hypothetical protein